MERLIAQHQHQIRYAHVIRRPSIWHSLPLSRLRRSRGKVGAEALCGNEIAMDDQKKPTWKVPPRQRTNARALRKNSTDAERLLWSELHDHRLKGARFSGKCRSKATLPTSRVI